MNGLPGLSSHKVASGWAMGSLTKFRTVASAAGVHDNVFNRSGDANVDKSAQFA